MPVIPPRLSSEVPEMTQAIALRIEGMTCVSCAEHVEKALEKVSGVHTEAVSYPKEKAEVTTDAGVGIELLAAAVATLGYRAIAVDTPVEPIGLPGKARRSSRDDDNANGDGGKLHVAVIGSGGGAGGGGIKDGRRGGRGPPPPPRPNWGPPRQCCFVAVQKHIPAVPFTPPPPDRAIF